MRELHHVVELDLLRARLSAGVDRHDVRPVIYVRMNPAQRAFSQTSNKLPDAFFGHQEVRSEGVRAHFAQIVTLAHAADQAPGITIQENMAVLVAPRKALADCWMRLIDDMKRPTRGWLTIQAGNIGRIFTSPVRTPWPSSRATGSPIGAEPQTQPRRSSIATCAPIWIASHLLLGTGNG